MLTSLSIKNYALIDALQVDFNTGFTIITGETGAGKSILLGGLSLILGKRADLSSLRNKTQKCIIEATFNVESYKLKHLYTKNDLDYEPQTIIRREILPSGKSRAFVNDSPVNLANLQLLGNYLIDIHSQHETLQLVDNAFQFKVIDALAKNETLLSEYSVTLSEYNKCKKELEKLLAFKAETIKEHDYNTFLLNELQSVSLETIKLQTLEEEYKTLNNIEAIQEKLTASNQLLNNEQVGLITNLNTLKTILKQLLSISNKYESLYNRVVSSQIELDDIYTEIENHQENLELNPSYLEDISTKLTTINTLFQKHTVNTIEDLIKIKTELQQKIFATENIENNITTKQSQITTIKKNLETLSQTIHKKRSEAIPELKQNLESILIKLGMPNAQFNIVLQYNEETYYSNGKDELSFMFSANKGGTFQPLKKAASGGELSRIMLAIKSILANYVQLPTIMFDEIDTGVSGEIANKMAEIMSQMSKTMQVFSITHLPQIAAKGHTHLKVFKTEVNNKTTTNITPLNHDDRIIEIAQMLSGIEISSSAIAHAKELLN